MKNNYPIKRQGCNHFRLRVYPFFWFIAAADESLLNHCPVPEQDKQAGIGMAILCTTVAAMISSYYAIHSLFNNWVIALPMAFFWGIIIFNLDRFMVGSLRKDKHKNWLNELKVASPRILLAFLIAILISKPLEVKIFENQIEAETFNFNNKKEVQVLVKQHNDVSERRSDLEKAKTDYRENKDKEDKFKDDPAYIIADEDYNSCVKEQASLEKQLETARQRRRQLYYNRNDDNEARINLQIQALNRQIKHLNAALGSLGCGNKEKIRKEKRDEYIKRRTQISDESRKISDSINSVLRQTANKVDSLSASESEKYKIASNDILGKLRILNSLKKNDQGMFLASMLITLLFFILELAPLIVKILSPRGEYDSLISMAEQQAFDREEASAEESRQEKNTRIKAASLNALHVEELDGKVKQRVQERILGAQAELAEKIVDAWKKQEEAELNTNTEEYLKTKISQTA